MIKVSAPLSVSHSGFLHLPVLLLIIAVLTIGTAYMITGRNDNKLSNGGQVAGVTTPAGSTVMWGAYIEGTHYGTKPTGGTYGTAPYDLDTWNKFELNTGKKVSLVQIGMPFKVGNNDGNFPAGDMDKIRNRGAIPFIGWGSWGVGNGRTIYQPEYKLSNVTRGDFDVYINKFARDSKAWNKPYFINLNHEQNLRNQFTWQYGGPIVDPVTGASFTNTAQDFVQSWRHVHNIFNCVSDAVWTAPVGCVPADNVTWAWIPNIYFIAGSTAVPFMDSYPGDRYVDWVGFNGFNHANGASGKWDTFSEIFCDSYKTLMKEVPGGGVCTTTMPSSAQMTCGGQIATPSDTCNTQNKPLIIMATASNEASGVTGDNGAMKAAWMRDAFQVQIPQNFPKIKAFMYFNWNSQSHNIVIESTANAQTAFAESIASNYYSAADFATLPAGKIEPLVVPTPTPSPSPSVIPNLVQLTPEADTYISSASASTNYGSATSLTVDGTTGGIKKAFLRFNLSGLLGKTLTSVKLKLRATSTGGTAAIQQVKFVNDDAWAEQFMTANNTVLPSAISSTPIGTLSSCANSALCEVTIDITRVQAQLTGTDGKLSVVLDTSSTDAFTFASKEDTANAPQLEATFALTSPSPSASLSPKPGDIDRNAKVDIYDYNQLLSEFGKKNDATTNSDLDDDNDVDIFDYTILLSNFGR